LQSIFAISRKLVPDIHADEVGDAGRLH